VTSGVTAPWVGITSDNIHLSEPIRAGLLSPNAVVSNPLSFQECADAKVLEFIAGATSVNTRRAYESDLRHYIAWGGKIPSTDRLIARYLADHAGLLAMSALARRLVAIRSAHIGRGLMDPTKSELVRLTFRGIRRKYGRAQRRVLALGPSDLLAIVRLLRQSPTDLRDAAILLVGFAGAFRRSELAGVDRNDIEIGEDGISISLRRSKTDQEGEGRTVRIPRVGGPLCPVATLQRWLAFAEIVAGAVFRPVTKDGKVLSARLSPDAIACILKKRVQAIGHDPAHYSGHSLRAGFATAAARIGEPMWRIRVQTGHLSDSVLERYIRDDELSSGAVRMIFASVVGSLTGVLHDAETQQITSS
jgi:integrase